MSKIFVTGGFGGIGTFVTLNLIEKGFHPIVLSRGRPNSFLRDVADKFTLVQGDLMDLENLKRAMRKHPIQGVIHLAKLVHGTGIPEKDPRTALEINVTGTANVLEAARFVNAGRVIFTSTKQVYSPISGEHAWPKFKPIREDYPKFDRADPGFVSIYAMTNKLSE